MKNLIKKKNATKLYRQMNTWILEINSLKKYPLDMAPLL